MWSLIPNLRDFRDKGILTDVILDVRGKLFKGHRIVLISGSLYFERLFLSGFKEGTQEIIKIEYDPQIFEKVFDLLYYGSTKIDLDLARALIFFDLKGFDIERYILSRSIYGEQIPSFIRFISEVYPNGIPMNVIDHLAHYLIGDPLPDLSEFSEDLISAILLSPEYSPKSIFEIWNLINGLVEKGHSPELYKLIDYDKFPFKQFSSEFLARYNREGPLPRLCEKAMMIVETPRLFLEGVLNWKTKLMGRSKIVYDAELCNLFNPPKVGDISRVYTCRPSPTQELKIDWRRDDMK